jgi:N-acetylneuraminic acid mutarotase
MKQKIRVNVTVDKENLEKAKTKLKLFGGKLSTLFNVYLEDFVKSMDKDSTQKSMNERIKELEDKVKRLEKGI